ncbi:MAG: CusA/CzcA family heavy metal efflux RND transporter [Sandaracinus sp.]
MIEAIARASVKQRIAVLATWAVLAAVGLVVGARLRFDALPDVTGTQVVVITTAPGYTPEEVERLVTRPVELATSGLPGQTDQRSISRYGLSAVTVVFENDYDLVRARQMVSERIALAAGNLPPGVDAPELGPMSGGLGEIYQFAVSSDRRTPAELMELVETRIAPRLRTVPGIVEVNTWGGGRRTLAVEGDPTRMARHHVTLRMLRDATERAVGAAAGASLDAGASHVLLRGLSLPVRPDELGGGLVTTTSEGMPIRISDVATVRVGMEPRIGAATTGGRGEVVYAMAQMLTGANALEVLAGVHGAMPQILASLPPDVVVNETYDRSELVGATLRTVGRSLLEGGILVVLVLFAMLGSGRAGALVASVIPLSMLGAVMGMVALGVPGNLMSLGALDFGLLVDGAVVLVETVFHRFHEEAPAPGTDLPTRIAGITASVARPVFYSVLIILLVYVPILSLEGVEGTMFRPMALTVVLALATALVLTLTYVPAAASFVLRPRDVPAKTPWLPRVLERGYEPVLALAVRWPLVPIALAVAGLVLGGALFFRAGTEFVPQLDEGDLVVQPSRHPDVSLDEAIAQAGRVEHAAMTVPEVLGATSRIGSPTVATDTMGIEQSDVFLRLRSRDEWRAGLTHEELVREIDAAIAPISPGVDLAYTQPIQMRFNELLGGSTSDVAVSVYGDDLVELRSLAERMARVLESVPGAEDVRITSPPGVPVLEVRPRAIDDAQLGLDATDVLDIVRAQRAGLLAGTTFDGPIRVPVRVHLGAPPTAFEAARALVPTARGSLVPLSALADVRQSETPALVSHQQAARRILIGFNVRERDLGSVVQEAETRIDAEVALPRGYRVVWGGQYESLERARARLAYVIPAVLVLIVALLVRVLERARSTLLVSLNVPFAAVGGMIALAMRGMPISISAAVGFIALSGIAVLNGVVLVARIHTEEERGLAPAAAALSAARSRLRPVLMTALVAGLGFVPMMMAHGVGAEVQAPLATVVVGGLFTSTLLTLVVLPTLYGKLVPARAATALAAPAPLAPEEA